MPEIEQNENVNTGTKPKKLSELKLITPGLGLVYDVPPTDILIVRDKILNPKNKIIIKNPGYRLKAPVLQEAFLVKTGTYSVIVANPDSPDGRYNQDIGAGDDIAIRIKVFLEVDKSPRSLRKLMEQQETYKDAIRAKAETIMRLLVNKYYQKDSHSSSLSDYTELKKEPFDMDAICREAMVTDDESIINIASEKTELLNDYGIDIKKFDFTDIDYSDRIKQVIAKNIEKENERKIAREEAELKKKIAEDEAQALKTRLSTEIQALRENGFTNEQIAYYMNLKNLPKNAVAVVGQPQGNMVSDFVTANIITNNMEQGQEENTKGRTR